MAFNFNQAQTNDLSDTLHANSSHQSSSSTYAVPTNIAFANYRNRPTQPDIVIPAAHLSPSSSSSSIGSSSELSPPSPPSPPSYFSNTMSESSSPALATLTRDQPYQRTLFHENSPLSSTLCYGRQIARFNLHPSTKRDLEINDLLWRVAQEGEYDPCSGNELLRNNVLALAFPEPLFKFLSSVSRGRLRVCMLEFLSMIAQGEDSEGLMNMQEELESSVWADLRRYMQSSENRGGRAREPNVSDADGSRPGQNEEIDVQDEGQSDKLKDDIKVLLRLCYLSPWKIEVYASYITPRDMSVTLSQLPSPPVFSMFGYFGLQEMESPHPTGRHRTSVVDRPLVRSSGRRPVGALTGRPVGEIGNRLSNKKMSFWRQFQFWRLFRRSVVHGCSVHPTAAIESMLSQHASGVIQETITRASVVMACAEAEETRGRVNLFQTIPVEVVNRYIVGYVLLG